MTLTRSIRILTLFIFVILGLNRGYAQTTVTLGNMSTTYISEKYPFDDYYNYSWSNVIYLNTEIGQAGTITKIAFYVYQGPSNLTMTNQKILMRHTTASSYTNSTYPSETGFTTVYNGSITYNQNGASGWQVITLTTPFAYNGTSNLEVLFENNNGSYSLSNFPYFYVTTGYAVNRTRRDYNDGSFPSTCANCAAVAYIPNTQLTMGCNSTVTINPSSSTICAGSSTSFTASGASTYTWSPSTGLNTTTSATVTATPTTTTVYTLSATDANSCIQTKTATVTVNPAPSLTINAGATAICTGSSTSFTASGASTYTWNPTTGLSSSTSAIVTANPTVTTTYTLSATGSNGCVGTKTITLTVNPLPTIAISPSAPAICVGSSTVITASGGSTYVWSPSTGLNTTTGASVTSNPTITTNYTVTGTDANGCVNTKAFSVTVNSLPTVAVTPTAVSICNGSNTTLTASGGTTYAWSPSTGLSSTTSATVTANPTVTTTYTVTGTNANGCSQAKTTVVTVNAAPALTISPSSAAICAGSSTSFTASGASTYTWSPTTGLSSSTSATVTANPTVTTTYTLNATSASGCTSSATAVVTVNNIPVLSVSPSNTTVCNGGSVSLTASGANTYTWSPATGLSASTGSSVNANPTTNTVYTITGTSAAGCTANTTASVNVSSVFAGSAVATGGSVTCNNGQVSLSLSNNGAVTVGTGTSSSNNYPFNGYYNYSWSDAIYLQSEIGSAGSISALSFYVNNSPSNYVMNSQQIYIRTTSASSFTNSTYPTTTGFTQVYNGTITYNGSGWKTITLSTPFTYDGVSNLEILYENHDGSWASGYPTFNYSASYSVNRVKRDYEDAAFPSSCYTCGAYANLPNTKFTISGTLGTFVKWQSSTDNVNYTDVSGGTTQNLTTNVNTSTYFRAQVTNGTCPAAYSTPAYYVTNNNYYVNDNSTNGDVYTTAVGSSSNDGRDKSRPQSSINYIFTNYSIGPCDTIFVDKGSFTEQVTINYPNGGNTQGYTVLHGAGIGKTILNAPTSGQNLYLNQPDYIKVEGFTMNSTQSYANIEVYEAAHNILTNNRITASGATNLIIYGDNLSANNNLVNYNTFVNSSSNGSAILVEGNVDSLTVQNDSLLMTNSAGQDAILVTTYATSSNSYYPAVGLINNNYISAYSYGVSLYGYDYPISTYTISNNNIKVLSKSSTDYAPIWLASVGSGSTDKTLIYNNRLSGGTNGFYLGSSADYMRIYNNYISGSDYGLMASTSTSNNNELYFNSFYTNKTTLYFAYSSDAYWKIKNNILYTTSTSSSDACISIGNNVTTSACNYNLYYSPSGASVARMNSTNYSSLTAWKAIDHSDETPLGDENSLYGNPAYLNTTNNILDIGASSPAAYTGTTITGINVDIYGLSRTSTPSMGADEPSEASNAFYFRSAQSGNWENVSTWQASTDGVNWIAANITPSFMQKSIEIKANTSVTINNSLTIDEVTVNGTLILANNSNNQLTINNGVQADLTINGTFQDNGPDSLVWTNNSSYILGSNGTLIIGSVNTGLGWKNNYQGGISNIPATANWILNKTGTTNPMLISANGMYYPNLTIQNNTSSFWTTSSGSIFGGTNTPPTIKGSLNIGGTGSNGVLFINQNTNSTPIPVQGNITVQTGSTLENDGTGFNVQGNFTVNGSFTGTKNLFFSGSNNQTLSGSAFSQISNLNLNKTGGSLTLNSPVAISNVLTLTKGYIITSATNLLTLNNGASVTGGSFASFVSGPIQKIGNSAFTFPTGKGTNYQPIGISAPATVTDAFTAEYFNVGQTLGLARDSTIDSLSTCEYWNLNETNGTDSIKVTAGWDSLSCNGDSAQYMRIALWNGVKWKDISQNPATGNARAGIILSRTIFPSGSILLPRINKCLFFSPIANVGLTIQNLYSSSGVSIGGTPSAIGGLPPYQYSWSPITGIIGSTTTSPTTANPSTTTTYILTVTDARHCHSQANTTVIVGSMSYAKMEKSLSSNYYLSKNNKIFFTIAGEYSTDVLDFSVYDYKRAIVLSSALSSPILPTIFKNGDNRYQLDVSSVTSGYYVLEVTNQKKEKFFLRFSK